MRTTIGVIAAVALTAPLLFFAGEGREAAAGADAGPPPVIAALARLEPASELIGIGAAADERVARILVSEGREVEAGAPLVELGSLAPRRARAAEARARLEEGRARLASLRAQAEALRRLALAEIARDEAVLGKQIEEARAAGRRADARLARSQASLDRLTPLNAGVSVAERDEARHDVREAEADIDWSRANLAEYEERLRQTPLVGAARLESLAAEARHEETAIGIASLEAAAAAAEAEADAACPRAPVRGRVLMVLARPGERAGTRPLLYMGDTSAVHAVAEVDQSRARFVREGQAAEVSSPALPGPVRARVLRVGEVVFRNDVFGDDPSAATNARVVPVRLVLEADPGGVAARLARLECDARIFPGAPDAPR
jgi:HlyD family secretion protein